MKKDYSEEIVDHCKLVDSRLEDRFGSIVDALLANFGQSIPQSVVKQSQVKATYNFFRHKDIECEMLVATERERLVHTLRSEKPRVVLAIQDTTELDYTDRRGSPDLGCMRYPETKGFYSHNHLIFNPNGLGLGIFDQVLWNYRPEEVGKKRENRKQTAFEDKASYRWYEQFEALQDTFETLPDTTAISITDREGDIHELLQARRLPTVHYIIRGRGDRSEDVSKINVRERLQSQPIVKTYEVTVPANHKNKKNKIPKRVAKVGLSYQNLTLNAPFRKKDSLIPVKPIDVTVVYVKEIDPPEDVKEPIEWVLYTSLSVHSMEDALQIVEYYKLRWLIEIFHFVLKQGAKVEQLDIETAHGLQNAIVTYAMIALQVQNLRYATQEYGQQPLDEVDNLEATSEDYKLLASFLNQKHQTQHPVDKIEPTVSDFFNLIAQLGGFQFQKNREAGVKIMWRGWQQWRIIKQTALILRI